MLLDFLVGKYNPKLFPINWNIYTHVHNGDPLVDENGFAICDPYTTRIPKKRNGSAEHNFSAARLVEKTQVQW